MTQMSSQIWIYSPSHFVSWLSMERQHSQHHKQLSLNVLCHLCILISEPKMRQPVKAVLRSLCEAFVSLREITPMMSLGSLGNVRREEELRGVIEVSTNWWSGCTLLFFYWERRRKEWKLIPEVKKQMQRCAFFLSWTHTYVTAAQTEGADGCKSCILRGGYVSVATSSGSHPSQTSSSLTSCWTRLKKKASVWEKAL